MSQKTSIGQNKYTRLISNTALFGISTFSSKLLSFFLTRLYTGVLTQASFGMVDLVTACANLLIPLVSLGISNAVIRFGLEKNISKKGVFTGGLVAIFTGFILLLCFYPLTSKVSLVSEYLTLLYIYVLISCLRTLCCQFVRAKMYTRLYAIDGICSTAFTVGFNILFLVVLKMGATGYLLSIICADLLSIIFLTCTAKLWQYISPSALSGTLFKQMLRYSLPLVPALMFWWVTNASDRFFISFMNGPEENGLYAAAYKIPSIVALISTIFTEAWQLSAVTDGQNKGRHQFFSKIFGALMGVSFLAGGGLIYICKIIMGFLVAPSYFEAWRYVPLLIIATVFSCFVSFFNSIYMVSKKSNLALYTMMAGAAINLALNWLLIPKFGPNGASFATFISYALVFVLRAVNTRKFIRVDIAPAKLILNTLILLIEALIIIYQVKFWVVWCGILMLALIWLNAGSLLHGVRQLLAKKLKKL